MSTGEKPPSGMGERYRRTDAHALNGTLDTPPASA